MADYASSEDLKPRLEQFLKLRGVEFTESKTFKCPFHDDRTESASIVPKSGGRVARCFACGENWDIFHFAAHFYGLSAKADFPEIVRRVRGELGQAAPGDSAAPKPEKPAEEPVKLPLEAARSIYTTEAIAAIGKFVFGRALAGGAELSLEAAWPCVNEAGEVEFVEARFSPSCFANGQKRSCAVWWNGRRLKAKGAPSGLFGRELLAGSPGLPVLIVEGPKCQEAAKAVPGFVPIAWNGGANGQKRADFSPLQGRQIFIWPDDDAPGMKSARETAKLLRGIASGVAIVEPLPEARAVKGEHADIVEALQVKSPGEIAAYILGYALAAESQESSNPYIAAGSFLAEKGFFRVYDRKSIGFFSMQEEQPYHFAEIRDKFEDDKVIGMNPAKAAKMIDNLDPAYPVYHLVKSFEYPPGYMGRGNEKNRHVINRWRGFAYPSGDAPPPGPDAEADAEFVKGHIREVICGGIEADYDYFCKWAAHMLQKPNEKPGVAIFAHSEAQGTGKSLVFEQLIPNILGIDITRVFSNEEQISEKFNSWLFESLYVVFSEQSFRGNAENIKSWITDPNQSRRDMGAESRQERSFARFVICTNKENAFMFDESERRMFVLNVSAKMVRNWPYFERLAAAVNSPAVLGCMARFFLSIDISAFNPFDLPESSKKREIIEAEKHPVIDFFEMVAFGEDRGCQLAPCNEIDPDSLENYHKSRALYEALREACAHGEFFIERKRLYDRWREALGRNRRETMNQFTRIIKTHYPPDKLEVLDQVVWESGKAKRNPVIVVKPAFFQ